MLLIAVMMTLWNKINDGFCLDFSEVHNHKRAIDIILVLCEYLYMEIDEHSSACRWILLILVLILITEEFCFGYLFSLLYLIFYFKLLFIRLNF